ncbi:hypothetical protein ACP275_01G122600 [Erythranthe tilingii]
MAAQGMELKIQFLFTPLNNKCLIRPTSLCWPLNFTRPKPVNRLPLSGVGTRKSRINISKIEELLKLGSGDEDDDDEEENSSGNKNEDSFVMNPEERKEWRRKIREVIDKAPDIEEEIDLVEKRKKMQNLLAQYPLVVDEEDPDWPEDADGWGFNLGQFFNKINDDYIQPIKDITSAEWEEAIFKDFSPLVVFVHNRYKRPKENEKIRDELEKAVHIIWNCRLPSPRCYAIDANLELDLVSALQVSVFPELIFTKAGKILYREKAIRTADELSKIMAFFYFGAAKPPCLNGIDNIEEPIPTL